MNEKRLLSVMFSDADQFREQLLHETLRHVRRKRRARRCGQALMVLAFAAFLAWLAIPRSGVIQAPLPAGTGIQMVHTHALPAHQIVSTRQDSVTVISSDVSTVALLGDDQLLDIVPGETKLLVWHAPHEAELVIVGP